MATMDWSTMAEENAPAVEAMRPARPDMKNLFAAGKLSASNKNSKQALLFKSLQWRQAYQNSDTYKYEVEPSFVKEDISFEVKQILNGEMKGLGTGTFVWPAAHIMSKYLEVAYGKSRLLGKHVCDIGTGTGITGFIAALLGADVVLTDQTCVLELLRDNTDQFIRTINEKLPNHSIGNLTIQEYDWEQKNSVSDRPFDLLLISDCVLPKLYPIDLLVDAVNNLIGDNTLALFSYEHRPYAHFDPRQEFQRLCKLHNLIVSVVPLSEQHPVYRAEDIELWEVRRASAAVCNDAFLADGRSKLVIHNWGDNQEHIDADLVSYEKRKNNFDHRIPKINSLKIAQTKGSGSGIGSILWPSSVLTSRLLLSGRYFDEPTQNSSNNQRDLCIDIGAGCGLTSIVAHHLGYNTIATDRPSLVNGLLKQNIDRYLSNASSSAVESSPLLECSALDWEAAALSSWQEQLQLTSSQRVRYIICSDCLYSSPAVQPLLLLLDHMIQRELHLCLHSPDAASRSIESVSIQVLMVNEMRSALEEFLYFSLHRPYENISVKVQEVPIATPDLIIVRTAEAFHVSPPLRACLLTWTCKA